MSSSITATTEHHSSPPQLPPISTFTSRTLSSIMPASPPSSGYDNKQSLKSLPILPKPSDLYLQGKGDRLELLSPPQQSYYTNNNHHYDTPSSTSTASTGSNSTSTTTTTNNTATPDQSTLWALFNQFQQQQQQQKQDNKSTDHSNKQLQQQQSSTDVFRRASDPIDHRAVTSEEVLAEKRRRNAGASARFRDRRKQRERELQDKCNDLEQRTKDLENALRRADPDHPLLLSKQSLDYSNRSVTSSPPPVPLSHHHQSQEDNSTLFDRVGQLEHLMTRFKQEKETDTQKLDELKRENNYLKSLLVPTSLPSGRKGNSNKRMRLSSRRSLSPDGDIASD